MKPNENVARNLPVAELAYLARHKRLRGQKLGDVLLIEALRVTVAAANHIGIAGVYLYATGEGAILYRRYGFLFYEGGRNRMFLPIRLVRAVVNATEAVRLI